MKNGLLQAFIIKPLMFLIVVLTLMVFVIGPPKTATFAKTMTTAIGLGTGLTLGSIPNLFENVQKGQALAGTPA
jgi:hypothetical protein